MLTSEQHRCSNEKKNFSAEFKRESAQLVVDQKYTWQMPPKLWMLAFPQ
ncbi:transposase ORF A, IS911 [Shigella flexneri 1485-80]|nr:transposase ORF A, IS911 [Shigella flexneri 1485-80]